MTLATRWTALTVKRHDLVTLKYSVSSQQQTVELTENALKICAFLPSLLPTRCGAVKARPTPKCQAVPHRYCQTWFPGWGKFLHVQYRSDVCLRNQGAAVWPYKASQALKGACHNGNSAIDL